MSKSMVSTANPTTQNVAVNSTIQLGTIQRRFGCALNAGSNSISLSQCGYYLVFYTMTFTAPATGVATITLTQNGTNLPGAAVSDTVATALTEQNTVTLVYPVRSTTGNDTLTFLNTGIAITPSNVTVTVVKL